VNSPDQHFVCIWKDGNISDLLQWIQIASCKTQLARVIVFNRSERSIELPVEYSQVRVISVRENWNEQNDSDE
jgi:hypothetical protein